ncbi:RTA1 domain-containing protein [Coccidioides immitis RS]|uniref:RTA1 domain-containing protein n=3 Tax=Coccidioides immitis TaxID=5501 RepID=J3K7Y9_COCIM|nr:RTA1 domain-containing protein [Coccidioides immitis RS]EAS30864.3 RTA1 domain-containing protein [Coccidioides immitis RS]KMP03451.1 hypothetical protein CIRG_03143 [Coccidioides immitis RMSCC 2394]KMU73989.1 hypothetical protein CISG_03967 [Coccidioides immitis RMSCC 3703]
MASSGSIYFYDPSLPASILFTILYAFPTAFLFYTTIIGPRTGKYGHAGYFVPLCIGAAMEVAAYADRCASIKQPGSIPLYAVSSSLVVIAPVFICASLYMLMGRLIRAGIPEAKGQQQVFGIAPRWLPRIFVASDIISFLTQALGSAIAAAGVWEGSEKGAGTNALIGGLALQLATFSMFFAIVVRFHRRVHALRHQVDDNLKKVLLGLYVAGFFIWVRCVYRLIEFALGIDGYPFWHEWCLYVLEACPMLFALCTLGYYHPGKWLPRSELSSAMQTQDKEANRTIQHQLS